MSGPRVIEVAPGQDPAQVMAELFPKESPAAERNPRGPAVFEAPPGVEYKPMEATPAPIALARPSRIGSFWIVGGLGVLLATWLCVSMASFVVREFALSAVLGGVSLAGFALGGALVGTAIGRDLASYRRLKNVDALRGVVLDRDCKLAASQAAVREWLRRLPDGVVLKPEAERLILQATRSDELVELLNAGPGNALRERAQARAGQTFSACGVVIAACPHPAFDAAVAGFLGLRLILQVAADHGLRAGPATTVVLIRHVMATMVVLGVTEALANAAVGGVAESVPGGKLAAELAGVSVTAVRFRRLAIMTHRACSPLEPVG